MSEQPYPGLRPFQRDETDIFFGRENHADDLVAVLEQTHFLVVLGPSGCGKSSLVRAGLLPALDIGFMASAGAYWSMATLTPGNQPFSRLASQLLKDEIFAESYGMAVKGDEFALGILEAELRRGPLALHEILDASPLPEGCNLHILVDQFEELFRYHRESSGEEAAAFVALLLEASKHSKVFITLTMRADFIGDCALYQGLPEAVNRGSFLTPRLSRAEMTDAISMPVKVFGGQVHPALVNHLLNEAVGQQDQLPLLQHALMRMWTLDQDQHLTLEEFEDLGGLSSSLSIHADQVFAELSPGQQKIAEMMFCRLTEGASGSRDTRRPAKANDIKELTGATLQQLTEIVEVFRKPGRSFLSTGVDEELTDNSVIDISHESLIRQWRRLREWTENEAKRAETYRQLARAANRWKSQKGELYRGRDLQQALSWREKFSPTPEWAVRYNKPQNLEFKLAMDFLTASENARNKEIENKRREQTRKQNRIRLVAVLSSLFFLALSLVVAIRYDRYSRIHYSYYADFSRKWGLPIGLRQLSEEQTKHRAVSLRFTRRGSNNPVDTIEAIDSLGRCTTAHNIGTFFEWGYQIKNKRFCRWEFIRDAQGGVLYEQTYDKNSQLVGGFIYVPLQLDEEQSQPLVRRGQAVSKDGYPKPQKKSKATFVTIEYTPQGYERLVRFTDRTGAPALGPDKQFGLRYEYDEKGRVTKMTSLDKSGNPMNDIVGNSSANYVYDEVGNVIRFAALDLDDKPVMIDDGYSIKELSYDRNSNLIEEKYFDTLQRPVESAHGYHKATSSYDERGNILEESYFDLKNRPTLMPSGYHRGTMEYDENNNVIRISYFDANSTLTTNTTGFASVKQEFDKEQNVTKNEFFDAYGNATLIKGGYAAIEYQYDSKGNQEKLSYKGIDGRPVFGKSGFSSQVTEYNDQNLPEHIKFYDTDNMLTVIKGGYAQYKNYYDDNENLIKGEYFGLNDERVLSEDGYAGWDSEYDQFGNKIKSSYFGLELQPIAVKKGYASWSMDYDDRGNEIRRTYFDDKGNRINMAAGYAIIESEYDHAGNETKRRYLNANGQLTTIKGGYAGWQTKYNEIGKQTEYLFFDINEHPVINNKKNYGYARSRSEYNNQGQLLQRTFFNQFDKLMMFPDDGYAIVKHGYESGNNIETLYMDTTDRPVRIKEGYHKVTREFDIFGRVVKISYFDVDGTSRIIGNEGYAVLEKEYDQWGRVITEKAFDANVTPTKIYPGRFHKVIREVDALGRVVSYRYFDINKEKTLHEDGYHQRKVSYDNQGNIILFEHFGINKERVKINPLKCSIWQFQYSNRNHLVESKTLDTIENPCETSEGYVSVKIKYDQWGREIGREIFDEKGLPALHPQGWYRWEQRLDWLGNVLEINYFGTDNKPSETIWGCALEKRKYDAFGNVIEFRWYGMNDKKALHKDYGYHRLTYKYDDRQQITETSSFDTFGNLVINHQGYARMVYEYDEYGRQVEEAYYDQNNRPLTRSSGYARMTLRYDEYGRQIEEAYYDQNSKPVAVYGCKRVRWTYDEVGTLGPFCD